MGGITSALFGGKKEKSSSQNQAYGTLLGLLQPNIGMGNTAMSTLGSILGIGDPAAGQSSLNNFLDSTGYKFLRDQGQAAITDNAAARGLLGSGSTAKRITSFNQDLASTKLNELMQNLFKFGDFGLNSANIISGAGQTSKSSGSSSNGIFNSLFPGGLSDPRLKTKLRYVDTNEQGIDVYRFEFRDMPGVAHVGVLATDVAAILPEALGPRIADYQMVDYSKVVPLPSLPFTDPVSMEDLNG